METKKEITQFKGIKKLMTQIFKSDGTLIPVTKISVETEVSEEFLNKDIKIVGTSKGKGWAGVMKKWNFKGQMATRGQSNTPRGAGSPGGQTPGRVLRGKKMAGRMGGNRVTIKGSQIVQIDNANKFIMVSGPVPGFNSAEVVLELI
jgi:large subunit ribosomal protein L3